MIQLPKRGGGDWSDRLNAFVEYESPSGTKIQAFYDSSSEKVEARGTAWEFPGVDGAFVQRTGSGGKVYETTFIFSGGDHDQRASQAMAAFLEPGFGKLTTPIYGKKPVAPLGEITRTNDFVNGLNASRVELSFFETLTNLYPGKRVDASSELKRKFAALNVASASKFGAALRIDTKQRELRAANAFQSAIKTTRGTLSKISRGNAQLRNTVQSQLNLVSSTVNTAINTPAILAGSFQELYQLPGQFVGDLINKISGYGRMGRDLFGSDIGGGDVSLIPFESSNNFAVADMAATAAFAGAARSVVDAEFVRRRDATGAALDLIQQSEDLIDWREARGGDLDILDPVENHNALQELLDAAVFLLVESSFSLPSQVSIELTEDRGLLDLAAELLGSIEDEDLDFFIKSNRFTGEELIEIPKGRRVVYLA